MTGKARRIRETTDAATVISRMTINARFSISIIFIRFPFCYFFIKSVSVIIAARTSNRLNTKQLRLEKVGDAGIICDFETLFNLSKPPRICFFCTQISIVMENPVRVLIIENQTLTRIGIETILGARKDFEIVGEAVNGADGFAKFRELKPDVTILSLRLPDSCAIDNLDDYFNENDRAKILILAEHAGDAEIARSLKKGANGYICKDVSENELLAAVRAVGTGKKYIPANIAEILSENFGQEELTARERKTLQALAAGKSNKEIAFDLSVSENTVKTHVKNVFEKLGVSDRTSAATLAIKRGLVRLDI